MPIREKEESQLKRKKEIGKSNTRLGKPKIPKECIGKNKRLEDIKNEIKERRPIKSL